jgi:protease IV
MSNTGKWVLGIGGIFLGVAIVFFAFAFFGLTTTLMSVNESDSYEESNGSGSDRVAIVDIDDVIVQSDEIIRELRRYAGRSNVKAIVLRMDSPGGAVAPSQEIYQEVRRIVESGTPVVVSMSSVAASGAYYIACGASRIVANPGTITGSIGVISEFTSYKLLMDKIGIENTTVKSGKYKDVGNPSREMTDEDYDHLQGLVNDIYEQFVDDVARSRKLPLDTVRNYADGRVYTGRQARAIGLIDTLGTMQTAIRIAGVLGKIEGEPRTVRSRRRSTFFERFFGARSQQTLEQLQQRVEHHAPMEYRLSY